MSSPKKILVVDDQPDTVTYMTTFLSDEGFQTCSAYDGVQALELARAEKPDLICLDISMPEKSGVKMFRELQEDPQLSKIPVIIVTGIQEDFKQFIHTRRQVKPPQGYVQKPIEQEELLNQIKKILNLA